MSKQKLKLHGSEESRQREERMRMRFSTVKKGWGRGFVKHPVFKKRMLLPHFWPHWFGFFMLWAIVTFLPYPVFMFIGKWLGRTLGMFSAGRKYILKCNLKLAFPTYTDEKRHAMAHRVLENAGMAMFETGMAWFWSDRRMLKHARIDPDELKLAKSLLASGKPVLVLSCHFFTLEIMARLFALLIKPGIGVYRPSEHPVMEYAQVHGRLRSNLALVSHKDPKSMIRALAQYKGPVWYAPDQDYGAKASVFVPFFGVKKAASVIGTHNMARVRGTIVLPAWTVREKGIYHLRILPALDKFPTSNATADTLRCNQVLERMIMTAPEQYLWLHRRFKTVPPGEDPKKRYPRIERL